MSSITMDFERRARCGVEEAVFCESKTAEQIDTVIQMANEEQRRLLLTRLDVDKFAALNSNHQVQLHFRKDSVRGRDILRYCHNHSITLDEIKRLETSVEDVFQVLTQSTSA